MWSMRRYAVVCDLRAYAGARNGVAACADMAGQQVRERCACVLQGARTAAAVAVCAVGRSANAKLNVIGLIGRRDAYGNREQNNARNAPAHAMCELVACRHARRGGRRGPGRAARIMWRGNREPAFVSCAGHAGEM